MRESSKTLQIGLYLYLKAIDSKKNSCGVKLITILADKFAIFGYIIDQSRIKAGSQMRYERIIYFCKSILL